MPNVGLIACYINNFCRSDVVDLVLLEDNRSGVLLSTADVGLPNMTRAGLCSQTVF